MKYQCLFGIAAYLSISATVISAPLPTATPGKLRKEYRERLNALIYAGLNP